MGSTLQAPVKLGAGALPSRHLLSPLVGVEESLVTHGERKSQSEEPTESCSYFSAIDFRGGMTGDARFSSRRRSLQFLFMELKRGSGDLKNA